MSLIINGTTPTIRWNLPADVDAQDIDAAYMTFSATNARETAILEKDISTAVLSGHTISWTLTQAETITLPSKVWIQLRYRIDDAAYASKMQTVTVGGIIKQGVI